MSLEVVPMSIREANRFVQHHHRHHGPVRGGLFAIGAEREGELVAVAILGRPASRHLQDGRTAEVTRLCCLEADVARHSASMLYAAAWRACRAIGYRRLVTYTLASEAGASLRGAGWRVVAEVGGRDWSRPKRPRDRQSPAQPQDKLRWEPVA